MPGRSAHGGTRPSAQTSRRNPHFSFPLVQLYSYKKHQQPQIQCVTEHGGGGGGGGESEINAATSFLVLPFAFIRSFFFCHYYFILLNGTSKVPSAP